MENSQERTLAYNLAKELNHHELDEISGAGDKFCMEPTFFVTGNSSSVDARTDLRVDW